MPPLTIGDAVLKSAEYLTKKGIDSPRLDAELLLCKVQDCDRLRLYMDWQKPLTDLETAAYRDYIRRRGVDREPVARIIGSRAFFGHVFEVTPASFVPRPETEGVVERALTMLKSHEPLNSQRQTVLEVGTGTGCIILSIAAHSDGHQYIATDISDGALATARSNARKLKLDHRVDFRKGSILAGYEGSIGLLVSNPPYIETAEIATLDPEVRVYDPMTALDGGTDGLDCFREILTAARKHLIHGGWMVFELGEEQPEKAAELIEATGEFEHISRERDLSGIVRYVSASRR